MLATFFKPVFSYTTAIFKIQSWQELLYSCISVLMYQTWYFGKVPATYNYPMIPLTEFSLHFIIMKQTSPCAVSPIHLHTTDMKPH